MGIGHACPTSTSTAASQKLPGLDLLRVFAILSVLIFHGGLLEFMPDGGGYIIRCGWMGVDIFFGLSGYLIGKQLLLPWRKGVAPDYRRFFSRRLFRTLPAYLVVLILYFCFPVIHPGQTLQPLWQYLTFCINVFIDHAQPRAFLHAWSLCVEEQFYLLCPLVIALLARRPSLKKTMITLGIFLLLGLCARVYTCLRFVVEPPFHLQGRFDVASYLKFVYYPTWNRVDELLVGVAVAAMQLFRPRWWQWACAAPNLVLAAGVGGMSLVAYLCNDQESLLFGTFGFPMLAVSIGLLVISGTQATSLLAKLAFPGSAALAASSYSLYLIHLIAFRLVLNPAMGLNGLSGWPKFGVAFLLSLVLGAVLYLCVERPFLTLRDKLDKTRST